MDSKFALICFLTHQLSLLPFKLSNHMNKPTNPNHQGKGYHVLPLILDIVFQAEILPALFRNSNTTLTLFCPRDQAFFKPKNPHPSLTLLKYHVVPFKMDKDTMEVTFRHGSKLDTLLLRHPLVVTSLPIGIGGNTSLNQVKVIEWDVYNAGILIVHGVEDFFDPAFQTLRYPQHDAMNVKEGSSQGFHRLKGAVEIISWFLFLAVVGSFHLYANSFIFFF